MKSTEAARALAARRKSHGPEPVRRWQCYDCELVMGTNEMRRHAKEASCAPFVDCLLCGMLMTRSQTRTHRCEEGK